MPEKAITIETKSHKMFTYQSCFVEKRMAIDQEKLFFRKESKGK